MVVRFIVRRNVLLLLVDTPLNGVRFLGYPGGTGGAGRAGLPGVDNAAFIRLLLSSCSTGFYCLELLFWRCKAPGKPARPALPAPPGDLWLKRAILAFWGLTFCCFLGYE